MEEESKEPSSNNREMSQEMSLMSFGMKTNNQGRDRLITEDSEAMVENS